SDACTGPATFPAAPPSIQVPPCAHDPLLFSCWRLYGGLVLQRDWVKTEPLGYVWTPHAAPRGSFEKRAVGKPDAHQAGPTQPPWQSSPTSACRGFHLDR